MPTDFRASVDEQRAIRRRNAQDLRAYLLLIPIIACLLSILFSMESSAFEAEIVYFATMD